MTESKHGTVVNSDYCRSCRAPVVWVITKAGKRMPVNPDTDDSHFATCPQRDNWRKAK